MGKAVNLIGKRFGMLTVIERRGTTPHGDARWLCQCDCGNTVVTQADVLKKGDRQSCGCLRREHLSMATKYDFVGRVFGFGKVLKRLPTTITGSSGKWLLKCVCGNEYTAISSELVNGNKQSCGCKTNIDAKIAYEQSIVGSRFGRLVVIEKDHVAKKTSFWKCKCDCGNTTVVNTSSLKTGNTTSCGCRNIEIQQNAVYRNIRTLDHEGTNLAILTMKRSKRNTSGVKGVSWNKTSKQWIAQLRFRGENVLHKSFKSKQDAISARKEAEEKFVKPFLEKYGKEERHGESITDNSNYTKRDRNLNAGKITGYQNAKEAINEHSL